MLASVYGSLKEQDRLSVHTSYVDESGNILFPASITATQLLFLGGAGVRDLCSSQSTQKL